MEIDFDRIDEAVLALLFLGRHDKIRTWKSFDWFAMERLHAKGFISDPSARQNPWPSPNKACCSPRRCSASYSRSVPCDGSRVHPSHWAPRSEDQLHGEVREGAGLTAFCHPHVRNCPLTGPVADIAETARMTHFGHRPPEFAVTHKAAPPTAFVVGRKPRVARST